ncbi:MAG: rRNA pseudouridine synthase [Dehalococcoidia bacterium]|nr:rRNA pseudouridine synthase [Dehalococcoidia bacterium]
MPAERLQKLLARAGHGSRRSAEVVIAAGRVTVDGTIAILGTRADPDTQRIEVDGEPIRLQPGEVTIALNKPTGIVVTAVDDRGRQTVFDILTDPPPHLRYVGRLDRDTSGLLLLTTDGELAHRLSHPRYEVMKTYEAMVDGIVAEGALEQLRRGVMLEDGMTAPAIVEQLPGTPPPAHFRVVIHEGRNRQVRRMFEAVGHHVSRLRRTEFGPVRLDGLAPGASRQLTPEELAALRALVGRGDPHEV